MPSAPARPRSSEVDAYLFIRDTLRSLGWDVRNPSRFPAGQVYTQSECLSHPRIKARLGLDKPENIVKISETDFWVIEAKREHKELPKALKEATGYAKAINGSKHIKAHFATGVAGNNCDGYLVRTRFLGPKAIEPITINSREISSLISPDIARTVLQHGPSIEDVPVNESTFLAAAEKINQNLHLGAINKNYRARVMAALLLSLVEDNPPNIDAAPSVLIGDINNRARRVLASQGKPEFFRYIEIALPATEDNHLKFKTAVVQTLQELNNLNIRSAMNSGTDVLGKFYEVFLKYGNGAKEIGIVLTPRHVTKFAVEVMGITDRDVIFDPTCGTGGFLVSAFDAVKRTHNAEQVNSFKQNNLFGVEQEPEVVALAIVNMIFRGDGKNNIVEGNCFQKHLRALEGTARSAGFTSEAQASRPLVATRVLMNPPFALKASDEKEYRFVDYALNQLRDNGLLFSVLPYPAMVKQGAYKDWRLRLLQNHTLLAVVTFPQELFYPIGVHTLGVFLRKGVPYPHGQAVLWLRGLNDGLVKKKGKRLPKEGALNDYPQIKDTLQAFLANPSLKVPSINKFQRAAPVDVSDPLLELVPENYIEQAPPTAHEVQSGVHRMIREAAAFLIQGSPNDD